MLSYASLFKPAQIMFRRVLKESNVINNTYITVWMENTS